MLRTDQNVTIKRADYQASAWLCSQVILDFQLDPKLTVVTATQSLSQNPNATLKTDLIFDGDTDLKLIRVFVNEVALSVDDYSVSNDQLRVKASAVPANGPFVLKTISSLAPEANSSLSGLYMSGGNFFTQCEAQGFRKITWFMDRPDIMAVYEVTLTASRKEFPVLLSNGNLVAQGNLDDGRHFTRWEDPFPKPSYLFALVAGDLVVSEQSIKKTNGKDALLQIWVKPGQLERTSHAMQALKDSIRWDNERYGLDLDLDRFMIVAVDDFNMGAMENKGLNIFNSSCVFATPALATDADYESIEAIVGHEYFHNWTGNRVTCRDWFQLTLKEGLTVFRDQEFSADMAAQACTTEQEATSTLAVQRIQNVSLLRRVQFAEDAGPMAHAIRPDSYQAIDNFYTVTVYEKGAEVIRMMQTLVGRAGFRKGMDCYFARHDGQAVTCDDFIAAIADANAIDLNQFKRWYSQAHTPILAITKRVINSNQIELHIEQRLPAGQEPFHIPFALGLVNQTAPNQNLSFSVLAQSNPSALATTQLIELKERSQLVRLQGDGRADFSLAVPSLLRGFSAPVLIQYNYSVQDLGTLAAFDGDAFNRWDATQSLALNAITQKLAGQHDQSVQSGLAWIKAIQQCLGDMSLSAAFKAEMIIMPAETLISERVRDLDAIQLRTVRLALMQQLAIAMRSDWPGIYKACASNGPYKPDPVSIGKRALRQVLLGYWAMTGDADVVIISHYQNSDNMTEKLGALLASRFALLSTRNTVFEAFAKDFGHEPLAMDKWYQAHASSIRSGDTPVLEIVKKLLADPRFDRNNPNRLRSLIALFLLGNLAEFHQPDGSGYRFFEEQIILIDAANPQMAARFARAMDRWPQFAKANQVMMQKSLAVLQAHPSLSTGTREIVEKALRAKTHSA